MENRETLSVEEAATRLGISPHTLRTWLRERRLAYYKVGGRVVIRAADIERFLAAHRIEAGA